ncbi:MAG: hypothetical protein HC820_05290 [Hydrococcus sp. RM1_1_31]|nr:hypothetical protein [Hydrococcus sp. RM1_1_31]
MSDSKKHPLYIAWIDEINPQAPKPDRDAQKFAKIASLIPGYIGWAMVAPLFLGMAGVLNAMASDAGMVRIFQWVVAWITKTARIIWYNIFFWPAKLVFYLINK